MLEDESEEEVEEGGMTQLACQPGCLRSWPDGMSTAPEGGGGSFSQGRSLSYQSGVSKGTSQLAAVLESPQEEGLGMERAEWVSRLEQANLYHSDYLLVPECYTGVG